MMNTRILTPYKYDLSGFGATISQMPLDRSKEEDLLEILLRPGYPDELVIPINTKYGSISTTASNLVEAVKLGNDFIEVVPYALIESIAAAAGMKLPASSIVMVRQKIADGKGSISPNDEKSLISARPLIDLTEMQVVFKNGVATFVEPEVQTPNQSDDEKLMLTASTPKDSSGSLVMLGIGILIIGAGALYFTSEKKKAKSKFKTSE